MIVNSRARDLNFSNVFPMGVPPKQTLYFFCSVQIFVYIGVRIPVKKNAFAT